MHQLGFVAYYFSQLEYASIWLADHVELVASTKGFKKRCDDARERLVPQLASIAIRAEWDAFFLAAAACSTQRNDILHNPLEVNAEQFLKSGIDKSKGIILLQVPGRPILGLRAVQDYSRKLVDLHFQMLDLMKRTMET